MLAAEEDARARGATGKELRLLALARARYTKRVGLGRKVLESSDLEDLVGKSAQWMRGRGFDLLTKAAEGTPCRCCEKCRVKQPDLKAVALLAETVNKALALELARLQAKKENSGRPATVKLDWPSEGAKG